MLYLFISESKHFYSDICAVTFLIEKLRIISLLYAVSTPLHSIVIDKNGYLLADSS